jgi:hypothetical protein
MQGPHAPPAAGPAQFRKSNSKTPQHIRSNRRNFNTLPDHTAELAGKNNINAPSVQMAGLKLLLAGTPVSRPLAASGFQSL